MNRNSKINQHIFRVSPIALLLDLMEQERYILPIKAAGSDQLIIELYSQEHIDANAKTHIDKQLTSLLP